MATGGTSSTSANQPTKLDESKESLSLLSILQAFDDPITEKQAWAILYQSAKTALQCLTSANPPSPPPTTSRHNNNNQQQPHQQQHANNNIHNLTDTSENEVMKCVVAKYPSQIRIHRDGHVLPHSFQVAADSIEAEKRTVAEREQQFLVGLGVAIYGALDFCFRQNNESRTLSPDLKQMIDFLLSADDDKCQSAAASVSSTSTTSSASASPAAAAAAAAASTMKTLSHVMDRCRMHIISDLSHQADYVSRTDCGELVAETFELLDCIAKISSAPEEWRKLTNNESETHSHELTEHHRAVWASLAPRDKTPDELLMETMETFRELKPTQCLLLDYRLALKDKLVLEQKELNQHFETAKVQLELKFAKEKKKLEEKVARGEKEKNELQRQKEDVEQRMSVSLQEFRDEWEKEKLEFQESIARAQLDIQKLIQEKNVLQDELDEERRLKEVAMNELARIQGSLGRELEEARHVTEQIQEQLIAERVARVAVAVEIRPPLPRRMRQNVPPPTRRPWR